MKIGNSQGIYFTNNEMELYGMRLGDVIDIDDMLIDTKPKRKKLPTIKNNKEMLNKIKKELK